MITTYLMSGCHQHQRLWAGDEGQEGTMKESMPFMTQVLSTTSNIFANVASTKSCTSAPV